MKVVLKKKKEHIEESPFKFKSQRIFPLFNEALNQKSSRHYQNNQRIFDLWIDLNRILQIVGPVCSCDAGNNSEGEAVVE